MKADWDQIKDMGGALASTGAAYGGVAIQEMRAPNVTPGLDLALAQSRDTGAMGR